jgi:hypothetical protein
MDRILHCLIVCFPAVLHVSASTVISYSQNITKEIEKKTKFVSYTHEFFTTMMGTVLHTGTNGCGQLRIGILYPRTARSCKFVLSSLTSRAIIATHTIYQIDSIRTGFDDVLYEPCAIWPLSYTPNFLQSV